MGQSRKTPRSAATYLDYANWRSAPAERLRDALGGSLLKQTAQKAVAALAQANIPHLVIGGLAVAEHGYVYTTADVDLVVPDVNAACDFLATHGFEEQPGPDGFRWSKVKVIMTCKETGVDVELMPAGTKVGEGQLPTPSPTRVSPTPQYVDVVTLISLKLDAYLSDPIARSKDQTAVVELLKTGKYPKDLPVHPAVRAEYVRIWTGLFEKP